MIRHFRIRNDSYLNWSKINSNKANRLSQPYQLEESTFNFGDNMNNISFLLHFGLNSFKANRKASSGAIMFAHVP